MKKKYKILSLIEISILSCFLFSTKNFFNKVQCVEVECEIIENKDNVIDVNVFQDIFKSLQTKSMVDIDLVDVRKNIQENRVVDDVKISKKKDKVSVKIKPHRILGIAYYNFTAPENSEESIKKAPEYILDNGDKIFLKLQEEKNFISVICDDENVKIVDILPVLSFINNNSQIKSMINTISLKNGNFYVTTILNDSFINLGSFFDTKSVICRICDMHKIIYFGNDFSRIELNDNVLFLQKKRI